MFTKTLDEWGRLMRNYYNKQGDLRDSDITNNYLSYWSDNGKNDS